MRPEEVAAEKMPAEKMPDEPVKQVTVRLPHALWEGIAEMAKERNGPSLNDMIVELIEAELRRRERERLLYALADQRSRLERRYGVMEDSTPYIRSLREGGWRGE